MRANQLASRTICVALYRHILTKIIIKTCLWINKYRNLIIFEFRPQNVHGFITQLYLAIASLNLIAFQFRPQNRFFHGLAQLS